MNGKAWTTRTSTDVLSDYQSGVLQISAGIDEAARDQGITLVILNGVAQGCHMIYRVIRNMKLNSVGFKLLKYVHMMMKIQTSGELTITKLDQVNLIVAGLFEFTTVVSDYDTIKVTDGRFDLLYAP